MSHLLKKATDFNQKYWLFFSAVMIVLIVILSLYPASQLPKAPGNDKSHHFIAYFLLATPITLARPKHWQLLCIVLIIFSGFIEIIQPHLNRYGEWRDLIANTLGVCCSVGLSIIVRMFRKN